MSNLIKIEINDQMGQTVNARDLYESLGIKKDFTDWFKQQVERMGLIEGRDFTPFWGESTGGRPSADFKVTVDIAKHLCMISGGEKAHQIREYFIQIERAWNSPEQIMARAIQIAQKQIQGLQLQIQSDKPYTNFGKSIAHSSDSITIGEFAKVCNNSGIKIGRNRLFDWMRDSGYLMKQGREFNNPKQVYVEQGLFELKESVIHTVKEDPIRATTLLTGKGQMYFLEKLTPAT